MLETQEGNLFDTIAICTYLAGTGKGSLNGVERLDAARIQEDIQLVQTQIMPSLMLVQSVVFGTADGVFSEDFTEA